MWVSKVFGRIQLEFDSAPHDCNKAANMNCADKIGGIGFRIWGLGFVMASKREFMGCSGRAEPQ